MQLVKSSTGSILLVRTAAPTAEGYSTTPATRDTVAGEVTPAELTDIANQAEAVKLSERTMRLGTITETGAPADLGDLAEPARVAGDGLPLGAPAVKIERNTDVPEGNTPPQPSQRVSPIAAAVAIEARAKAAEASATGEVAVDKPLTTVPPAQSTLATATGGSVDPATGLRLGGPTIEEFMRAGYAAAAYPPEGYAPVDTVGWQAEQQRRGAAMTTAPATTPLTPLARTSVTVPATTTTPAPTDPATTTVGQPPTTPPAEPPQGK